MDQTAAQHLRPAVIVPHRRLVLCAALIATFMPANRLGSAQGKRIFVSTAQDEAFDTRARCSMSGSTERRPRTASITIGKIASISAIAIFGSGPVPIQITNSGASATFGMELSATSSV